MSEGPKGYRVLSKQCTAKSILYFVSRWGRRYAVKEYTDYRFSARTSAQTPSGVLKQAEERTKTYFAHLQKLARKMRRAMRRDGLANIPLDVFRQDRSIYKVTNLLEPCGVDADELHETLDMKQMTVFLCTLLSQLDSFEEIGLIHCDLKPDNVIICRRKGDVYSASLIDYDSGILIGDDDAHYVDYTPEYAAPEMQRYKANEENEQGRELRAQLTCAADMFSAAALMVHYLTGQPISLGDMLISEMLEAGRVLWVPKVHPVWRTLIQKTLRLAPQRRLSAAQMLEGMMRAQDSGLMEELRRPFADVDWDVRMECGAQTVLLSRSEGGRRASWYLDESWIFSTDQDEENIWHARDRAVLGRRAKIRALCSEVSALADPRAALYPVEAWAQGRRFFVSVNLPSQNVKKLSELDRHMNEEQADRFMLALLEGVRRLHDKGLLCSLMDADDVWCIGGEAGENAPVLGGLHRLLRKDNLPDRDEIDICPRIVSPEMCIYLGNNDGELNGQIAEMIGEWSDLFNLGAIYHLLLTGSLPFMIDENERYLGEAVGADDECCPALLLDGKMDERRRELIRRMLSYEPEERPESCAEVIAAIRSFADIRAVQKVCPAGNGDGKADRNQPAEMQWLDCGEDDESVFVEGEALEWMDAQGDFSLEDELIEEAFDSQDGLEWIDAEEEDVLGLEADEELLSEEELERRELLKRICKTISRAEGAQPAAEKAPKKGKRSAKKIYERLEGEKTSGWMRVRRTEDGLQAWAHSTGTEPGENKAHTARLRKLAVKSRQLGKNSCILPIDKVCVPEDGMNVCSIVHAPHEECRSLLSEALRGEISEKDECMKLIVKGVQAMHEAGLLCGAAVAENAVMLNGELKMNAAEYALNAADAADTALWREWMAPHRIGADGERRADCAGAYLSPEAQRLLRGGELTLDSRSDIFSLGVLYHVLWCGRLPACGSETGGWDEALRNERIKLNAQIPFAQRMLIERMLSFEPSERPADCAQVLEEMNLIAIKRGKTHTVTVKRGGEPVVHKKAWLYSVIDGKERFVSTAVTDRQGRAAFVGYLPEGKYFVRCDGEKVTCRWRNF